MKTSFSYLPILGILLLLFVAIAGCRESGGNDIVSPAVSGPTTVVVGGQLLGLPATAAPPLAGPARAPAEVVVSGAVVTLFGLTAVTDSSGYFRLDLPEGNFSGNNAQEANATITATGYPFTSVRLSLKPGETRLLRVRLTAGAATASGSALQVTERSIIGLPGATGISEISNLLDEQIIKIEEGTTTSTDPALIQGLTSVTSATFKLDGAILPTSETPALPWVAITAGNDGNQLFEIRNVTAGAHALVIEKSGYTSGATTVETFAGLTRSNVLLPIQPLASLGNLTLTVLSGNNQTAPAGTTLTAPLIAVVKTSSGTPVGGIEVTFTTTDGGTIDTDPQLTGNQTSIYTNYDGRAICSNWILGPATGAQKLVAQMSSGTPVTFDATATTAVANGLTLIAASSSATVNSTVTLTATVTTGSGTPLSKSPVTFTIISAPGPVSGAGSARIIETNPVLSDIDGKATVTLQLSTSSGVHEVEAQVAGNTVTERVTVIALAGAASSISISPTSSANVIAGQTKVITATITDNFGNSTGNGESVVFAITDPDNNNVGTGTLSQQTVTAINGSASTTLDPGTLAGDDYTITATTGGFSGQSATITVVAAPASRFNLPVPTGVLAGVSFNWPAISAQDQFGNLDKSYAGSKTLTWSGSASSAAGQSAVYTTTVVFTAGISTTPLNTILYNSASTSLTVNSASVTGTSSPFTVLPGSFSSISFEPATASTVPSAAPLLHLVIHLTDSYGNTVAIDRTVNLTSSDPLPANTNVITIPATVAAVNGLAELDITLSAIAGDDIIITAEADGISADTPVYSSGAGAATKFAVEVPASGTAGIEMLLPRILAQDASGNTVVDFSGTVTMRFSGPGIAPNGSEPVYPASVVFVSGIATDVPITLTRAETAVITVTDGNLNGISPALSVIAGAAARIVVEPSTNALVSADLASQSIIAHIFDGYDNPAADGTAVTLAIEDPGTTNAGTGSISPQATTVRDGRINALLATSTKENDDFVIAVTSGNFTARSGVITVGAIGVDHFAFTMPANPVAGIPFGVTLTAVDAGGNPVTTFQGSKPMTITGPGNAPDGTTPLLATSVFFQQGVSLTPVPFTFYNAETFNLSIQHDGITTLSTPITVQAGGLARINLTPSGATSVSADNPTLAFSIQLQDNWNNPVADGQSVSIMVLDPGTANTGVAGTVTAPGTSVAGLINSTLTTAGKAGDDYQLLVSSGGILAVSGVITVTNGIPTGFAFTLPINATAGIPFFVNNLRAVDSNGNTSLSYNGTRTMVWSGAGNSPSGLPPTFTTTVNFANGVATTSLATVLKKAEGPINLAVTDGTYNGTGGPITVEAGPAHQLILADQPGNSFWDVPLYPNPVIQFFDVFDNLRTNDNSTAVTVSLETAPGGAILTGTTPRTVSAGQVTFDDLYVSMAGTGFSLRVTAGSLTRLTSTFTMDSPPPRVTSVTTGHGDGQFRAGEVIDFKVVFNTVVQVDTLGGTPGLQLAHGPEAGYISGSGTTDLFFRYTVAPGDNSSSLSTASVNALVRNGGTITQGGIVNAQLGLPDPNLFAAAHDIIIDTTAPAEATPNSFDVTGGTVLAGLINSTNSNLTVTAAIPVDEATGGSAELLIDGLSFGIPLIDSTISATDSTVTFDVASPDPATLQTRVPAGGVLTVKLIDKAGNVTISTASLTFTVDYILPTAPTSITISPSGGTIVASTVNSSNANLAVTATIVAGDATGGSAELLIDGVAPAQTVIDSIIASGDTMLVLDFGAANSTELQNRLLTGGVISIRLTDAAGNTITTTAGNPTLIVDYIAPALAGSISQLPQSGTIVTGYLNSTNTNFIVSLPLTAGDMSGGLAELFINGVAAAPAISNAAIAPGDTTVLLDAGLLSALDLQTRFPAATYTLGVRLTDAAGNVTLLPSLGSLTANYNIPITPEGPTLAAIGGTVMTNILNSTNTNFTASANISAGTATGGWAELKINGASLIPPVKDTDIQAGDITVDFNLNTTDPAVVQSQFPAGGLVTVTLFTISGNPATSTLANPTLTVDYVVPTAPTGLVAASSGGTIIPGYTNLSNANLTVTASITAGQATDGYAELLVNGTSLTPPVKDLSILIGDTTVTLDPGSSNNATLQTILIEGTLQLSVRLVDAAGNPVENSSGDNQTLIADYTRPAAPVIDAPAVAADTGGTGNVADKVNQNLRNNMSSFRSRIANTATGAESGSLFLGLKDSMGSITFSTPPAITAGAATASIGGFPAGCIDTFQDGILQLSAWIRDAAGNTSSIVRTNLILDTVLPAAPVFNSPLIPANLSGHGNTADHVNLSLRNLFSDFRVSLANSAGGAENGTVFITVRDSGSSIVESLNGLPITIGQDSTFGVFSDGIVNGFVDGDLTIDAWIIDNAGNKSIVSNPGSSQTLNSCFDTIPATVTVNSLITLDTTPALSGNISDPLATLSVFVNGVSYSGGDVNNLGATWTILAGTINPPLTTGNYDIAVSVLDAAGNQSQDTTLNELQIQ